MGIYFHQWRRYRCAQTRVTDGGTGTRGVSSGPRVAVVGDGARFQQVTPVVRSVRPVMAPGPYVLK